MLRCKDLKSLPSLSQLRYLTGTRGLENIIRWIYTPEDDDFTDWVHGGELLIVSGAASHRPAFNLSRVLREAVRMNLSGAILLIGEQYIKDIPQNIIDAASSKGFPLMTIPWDTPLVDIQESIARAIVLSDHVPQQGNLLELALAGRISAQDFSARAAAAGYPVGAPQVFCVFSFLPKHADGKEVERITSETAQALGTLIGKRSFLSCYSFNQIYILISVTDDHPTTEALLANLYSTAHEHLALEECCAGATFAPALGDIIILYHEARTALDIARSQRLHHAPYVYEHGGLAELIVGSSMTEHFRSFANSLLAPVLAHDKRSHGRLMETLTAFVTANGNVLHAAEQLYIHRNTLKYRLRQVEKILGGSLDDPDLRLKLQLALYIRRLLG